jgi:hypothetical protein
MKFQVEVSSSLAYHLKTMIEQYVEECVEEKTGSLEGIHLHAYLLYFSAVASIESFMNEVFLSEESKQLTPNASLWATPLENLEFLRLENKLISVPESLFGRTFNRGHQPFQDMDTLIKVRNYLIHHKNRDTVPPFIEHLINRHIIPSDIWGAVRISTVIKLSSVTGTLWAYNTVCKTVIELLGFSTPEYQEAKFYEWFTPLPNDYVQQKFGEHK